MSKEKSSNHIFLGAKSNLIRVLICPKFLWGLQLKKSEVVWFETLFSPQRSKTSKRRNYDTIIFEMSPQKTILSTLPIVICSFIGDEIYRNYTCQQKLTIFQEATLGTLLWLLFWRPSWDKDIPFRVGLVGW